MLILLIFVQALQVIILWTHDWIPLGRLNDVSAVRSAHTTSGLVIVTLIQSVPYSIGLYFSVANLSTQIPAWLWSWLWISYVLLFLGELRAWWLPYLFRPEPERAKRYRLMFGNTHTFLPLRNGIAPNTLHFILHFCTAATLIVLAMLTL
ncbi:MAG TPA: hypothetical protein VK446_06615 [Methylocystis sp.]|nr:hypothetical protein [Methylocystis sp.]